MGDNPKKLLCAWYVDRAWEEQLNKKVKDPLVAAEIYVMLRAVLQETDETKFDSYLSQLIEGMGINTNMVLELFHRAFKYNYLKGKTNKRNDSCLVNLLKYVRDKSFSRFIKLTRGGCCNKT